MYEVDKNYEKLIKGKYTYFLDNRLQLLLKRKLNIKYNIYIPYVDSEKVIFYTDKIPNIIDLFGN